MKLGFAIHTNTRFGLLLAFSWRHLFTSIIACLLSNAYAIEKELAIPGGSPKIFWNGTELRISEKVSISPSPNGEKFAIWKTSPVSPWFGIYSVTTKNLKLIPLPSKHIWDSARWSYDSTSLVVESYPIVGDAKRETSVTTGITIVDAGMGTSRVLMRGEGLNGIPFFSRNNKFVYYFHGDLRKEGKTLGANFSLFRTSVANPKAQQLTNIPFYSVSAGEETADGKAVIFSGIQLNQTAQGRPTGIHVYSLATSTLSSISLPLKEISNVRVSSDGSVIFSATASWRDEHAAYQFEIGKGSQATKLFPLIWQTGRPARPSKFELMGRSQILHCWSKDKIENKVGGDTVECRVYQR
ncbi:MAG: hypothetical protein FD157_3264 [Rhodocyclaceae bacterium]|nr:MAG: hypothetical protein FD157_3264 [Rhodocyclaceae bacterium]TND03625.1 MAG: hypothetical protein FD118_1444 [Rhodocyclaceae bacterium]